MRSGSKLSKIREAVCYGTEPGSRIRVIYSPSYENGEIVLVETGKQDTQELIDSWAEFTDMAFIMSRLLAGDASPLMVSDPFYGDFTGLPQNHAEMLNSIIDARAYFDHLSDDVRARFDNDFTKWFGSAGSPEWAQNMTRSVAPAETVTPTPVPDKEVKE